MKSLRVVSFILVLMLAVFLPGCVNEKQSGNDSDDLLGAVQRKMRIEDSEPGWWKHDLPQMEVETTIQDLHLVPAFQWSVRIRDDKSQVLHCIENLVDEYTLHKAKHEFESLRVIAAQTPDEPLPDKYSFLIAKAKKGYQLIGEKTPTNWTAESTLTGFLNASEAFAYFAYPFFHDRYNADNDSSVFSTVPNLEVAMRISIQPDTARISELTGTTPNHSDLKQATDRSVKILENIMRSLFLDSILIRRTGDTTLILDSVAYDSTSKNSLHFCRIDEQQSIRLHDFTSMNPGSILNPDGNITVEEIRDSPLLLRGYHRIDNDEEKVEVKYLFVERVAELNNSHIESVEIGKDTMGNPQLTLLFDREGGELLYEVSSKNVGKPLAVMLNDRIIMEARIAEPIRESLRIIGLTAKEVEIITKQIQSSNL